MVVDGGVQVAVAGARAGPAPGLAAQHLVSAAVGDVAELFDVHVDQFAGAFTFVAAYDPAGGPVQVGEAGQAEAGQHAVHGRGHQVQQVCDAGRSPAAQDADLDDPALGAGRGAARAGTRAGGAVAHAGFAELPVAVGPAPGGGGRDLEAFRSSAQGPVVLDHAAGQAQPSGLGQGCITVGHEGLSLRCRRRNPHRTGRPSPVQDPSAETWLTRPQPPETEQFPAPLSARGPVAVRAVPRAPVGPRAGGGAHNSPHPCRPAGRWRCAQLPAPLGWAGVRVKPRARRGCARSSPRPCRAAGLWGLNAQFPAPLGVAPQQDAVRANDAAAVAR